MKTFDLLIIGLASNTLASWILSYSTLFINLFTLPGKGRAAFPFFIREKMYIPNIKEALFFAALFLWVGGMLEAQWRRWTFSARRFKDKVITSIMMGLWICLIVYYIWSTYGEILQQYMSFVMNWIRLSQTSLVRGSLFVQRLDEVHWFLLFALIMILVGTWSFIWVTRVGAAPGNSNQQISYNNTSDNDNGSSVNVAMLQLLQKMTDKIIPSPTSDGYERRCDAMEREMFELSNIIQDIRRELHQISFNKIQTTSSNTQIHVIEELKEEIMDIKNRLEDINATIIEDKSHDEYIGMKEIVYDDFDEEAVSDIPCVNVARGKNYGGKNVRKENKNKTIVEKESVPVTRDILGGDDFKRFIGKKRKDIIEELKAEEKAIRDAERLPEGLTDEEKKHGRTSLAALDRMWRKRLNFGIKLTDYIEIGILDEEQLKLPRKYVKEIIQARRTADFLKRMKEEGRETIKCQQCNKIYLADKVHNCFFSKWTSDTTKHGFPADKRIVISQTGTGNIQIAQRAQLNPKKLNDAYKKLTQYKMVLDDAGTPLKTSDEENVVVEVSGDDIMIEGIEGQKVCGQNDCGVVSYINMTPQINSSNIQRDFQRMDSMYIPR